MTPLEQLLQSIPYVTRRLYNDWVTHAKQEYKRTVLNFKTHKHDNKNTLEK